MKRRADQMRAVSIEPLPTAAVSVGLIEGQPVLDLAYEQDSRADVDMNVVMNGAGQYIELQGTGERTTFTPTQLQQMLELAHGGIGQLIEAQQRVLQAIA
jgi:ribonuclease PH